MTTSEHYDDGHVLRPGYTVAVNNTSRDELILTFAQMRSIAAQIEGRQISRRPTNEDDQ